MGKFIIGLVLGIAIAAGLAFYLNNMPNQFVQRVGNVANVLHTASSPMILSPGSKLQEVSSSSVSTGQNPNNTNTSAPSYDFYSVLQGKNASDVQRNAGKVQQNIGNQTNNQSKIYVAAGAFANSDAASNMAAQLTLIGYEPKIRTEQSKNQVINRILIGPFDSQNKAQDVITDLSKQNIKAVIYTDNNK
jgi:cell division protein FtsN